MKRIKLSTFLLILTYLVVAGMMTEKHTKKSVNAMRVLFPLKHLHHEDGLIKPLRIKTSYEAYLFENLSSGLLKEDSREDSGYDADLATSWNQPSNKTWVFNIRSDLKWSDGSALQLDEIRSNLLKACHDENRLVSLKKILDIKVDENANTLTFLFSEPVSKEVLHELSLYESLIYKDIEGLSKWAVTSGPYSLVLDGQIDTKTKLDLVANRHHHAFNESMIKDVQIKAIGPLENYAEVFKSLDGDFVLRPPSVIIKSNLKLDESAPMSYQGAKNLTHFIRFNAGNVQTHSLKLRHEIASLFKNAVSEIMLPKGLAADDQLIPEGYYSRLQTYEFVPTSMVELRGQTILIDYPAFYSEFEIFKNKIIEIGEKNGVKFEFRSSPSVGFVDSKSFLTIEASEFNKNVPYESWNYLLNRTQSAAYDFRNEFETLLARANKEKDSAKQNKMFQKIHRDLLDGYYLVPLYSEANIIYTSNRVTLTNVKKFDLRSRFYDVRFTNKI